MTRDDITRMAREAGFVGFDSDNGSLRRFASLVAAAEREAMIEQGWRQCAKDQQTTQFCGMVEQAVLAEREACAKVAEGWAYLPEENFTKAQIVKNMGKTIAHHIRARGQA